MNSSTHPPNDHVLDLALDYLEGRLDPDQTDDVRQHLRQCDTCRIDFEHASALRGAAIESGARHIHSMRLVELSDGAHASVEEREHLDSCPSCDEKFHWSQNLELPADLHHEIRAESAAPDAVSGAATGPARAFAWPRMFQLGTLFAAAAVVILLALPQGPDSVITELANLSALPVADTGATRGGTRFESGLEAYRQGDYAISRSHLRAAVEENPENAEAHLYLGSTAFLLGDLDEARRSFERAIQHTDPDFMTETGAAAHYQLANVHLARGEADAARTELTRVIEIAGLFAPEAEAQREKLDAAK